MMKKSFRLQDSTVRRSVAEKSDCCKPSSQGRGPHGPAVPIEQGVAHESVRGLQGGPWESVREMIIFEYKDMWDAIGGARGREFMSLMENFEANEEKLAPVIVSFPPGEARDQAITREFMMAKERGEVAEVSKVGDQRSTEQMADFVRQFQDVAD